MHKRLGIVGLFIFFMSVITLAQSSSLVYLCVEPLVNTREDSEIIPEPYLLAFQTTTLVGFIPSENVNITIYSDPSIVVLGGLYHILPDANSGGSIRAGRIATSFTTYGLVSESKCNFKGVIDAKLLTDETILHRSMPLPASPNQALLMKVFPAEYVLPGITWMPTPEAQLAAEFEMDNAPILSNLAFSFLSPDKNFAKSFQFVQLNTEFIDITLPFLYGATEDVDFALISNKEVTMSLSSFDFMDEFTGSRGSKRYVSADKDLQSSRYNTNLYNLLRDNNFRVYPEITIIDYYQRGFIRFEIGDGLPQRRDLFVTVDEATDNPQRVQPLDIQNGIANFYVPNSAYIGDPNGRLQTKADDTTPQSVDVVGVNERGELLIEQEGQTYVVEAWLVEPVLP